MHILAAILSILGAGAFWFCRMRPAGQALSEVGDAAKRFRGAYRRNRFRIKAEIFPVAAVDDPAAAATAFLISLAASRGSLTPEAETAIKGQMRSVMAVPNVEDVFVFARRVADLFTTRAISRSASRSSGSATCSPENGRSSLKWHLGSRPLTANPRVFRSAACARCMCGSA